MKGMSRTIGLLPGVLLATAGCPQSSQPPAPAASATAAVPAPSPPKRHPVTTAEVPKPVLDAFAKGYPAAKVTGWTQRGDSYTAQGQDATHWLTIAFASDGSVKETQEEIAVAQAPDVVKNAFQSSPYAKMTFVDGIKKIAVGKDDENATLYKFVIQDGGKNLVAVYNKTGKLVKEKTMPTDKFEKWHAEHTLTR